MKERNKLFWTVLFFTFQKVNIKKENTVLDFEIKFLELSNNSNVFKNEFFKF